MKYLPDLLVRKNLHNRLLYGSDYPINTVLPMIKMTLLLYKKYALLSDVDDFSLFVKNVTELYSYNPFAASVLMLRAISYDGQRFSDDIFYKNIRKLMAKIDD